MWHLKTPEDDRYEVERAYFGDRDQADRAIVTTLIGGS
jgi:hypothetical protein